MRIAKLFVVLFVSVLVLSSGCTAVPTVDATTASAPAAETPKVEAPEELTPDQAAAKFLALLEQAFPKPADPAAARTATTDPAAAQAGDSEHQADPTEAEILAADKAKAAADKAKAIADARDTALREWIKGSPEQAAEFTELSIVTAAEAESYLNYKAQWLGYNYGGYIVTAETVKKMWTAKKAAAASTTK